MLVIYKTCFFANPPVAENTIAVRVSSSTSPILLLCPHLGELMVIIALPLACLLEGARSLNTPTSGSLDLDQTQYD